ncbi:uncharacterized protein F54H12.2-like [Ostrea edulis]|uniref:uncharacterized protein F54H12.2-like n=1 Tax=Ostrea edulis TaxID=37623 RepID=UPI0024AFBD28|nr:uncharacterized protein F54H12.2-like [Ostrea edulis]
MSILSNEMFKEAMPSQLSLFDLPPTQTAVENIYFQDVRPISQISDSSPIEFQLSAQNGMDYVDLKRSRLYVKLKVTNGEKALASEDIVGPVNLLLPSLFSQLDVSMQNKPINRSGAHYPYLSMLSTLINYGADAKSSQLTSQLWESDTAGEFDDANAKNGKNAGLLRRAVFVKGSKSVDLEGPIMHELFQMDRYILNQVGISLKIYRTRAEFCLMSTIASGKNYQIQLEEVILRVCKCKINPAVILSHAKMLETTTAKYPFKKSIVKMYNLAKGLLNVSLENMFSGTRPDRLYIAFVSSLAAAGDYSKNPYNFQHFNISQIALYSDGNPVGNTPIKLNFDAASGENVVAAYVNLFDNASKWLFDGGNAITRKQYAEGGNVIFCFDLEPTFEQGEYLTLLKQGNVRIEAQFSAALPETVTAIVWGQYSALFEINQARDIITV